MRLSRSRRSTRSGRNSFARASSCTPSITASRTISRTKKSSAASRWRRQWAFGIHHRFRQRRCVEARQRIRREVRHHRGNAQPRQHEGERVLDARRLPARDGRQSERPGESRHRSFTAANFDAVEYVQKFSDYIVTLHIKDRKKNHGANMPFGQGDTPIRQVLQSLRNRKLKIPAMIEYEYDGKDTLEEVRRCYEFCRDAVKEG